MKKILYLTDLCYQAKGREYFREDLYITGVLKDHFDIAICHIKNAEAYEDQADLIVFRNTGSVIGYRDTYDCFVRRVHEKGLNTYNTFDGKADMRGKQYLVDLSAEGFPRRRQWTGLRTSRASGSAPAMSSSPRTAPTPSGSSSSRRRSSSQGTFPLVRCSFSPPLTSSTRCPFTTSTTVWSTRCTPRTKGKRWALRKYEPTPLDKAFADSFVRWNTIRRGIQRVDACRTHDGKLLLVELEDLNPFLSVLDLDEETRAEFMEEFIAALRGSM